MMSQFLFESSSSSSLFIYYHTCLRMEYSSSNLRSKRSCGILRIERNLLVENVAPSSTLRVQLGSRRFPDTIRPVVKKEKTDKTIY